MKVGRPAKELTVTGVDRTKLESIARSQSMPAALSRRARMILQMADGESNMQWRVASESAARP